jgi:hypothetical protein
VRVCVGQCCLFLCLARLCLVSPVCVTAFSAQIDLSGFIQTDSGQSCTCTGRRKGSLVACLLTDRSGWSMNCLSHHQPDPINALGCGCVIRCTVTQLCTKYMPAYLFRNLLHPSWILDAVSFTTACILVYFLLREDNII